MQVMFVSQSEKKALMESRRVLDAFANRIGDNVWQTVITQDGLAMVHKLLRQTASKNTAVSCHWIRSRHTSELLWTVGRKDKFDAEGHVPVNTTQRKILSHYQETGWTFMPMIQALSAVAALLHDLGKASDYFQKKLKNRELKPDPFRHELISALLVRGMYLYYAEKGTDLFSALAAGELPSIKDILPYCRNEEEEAKAQYRPFKGEASVTLFCVLWLILSHHRLPLPLNENGDEASEVTFSAGAHSLRELFSYITAGKTYRRSVEKDDDQSTENFKAELEQCFTFSEDLAVFSDKWRHELKKWCLRLKDISAQLEECSQSGALRSVLKYARLSLMLGDHFYSSQQADTTWQSDCRLYANTDAFQRVLSQRLDEHLSGVKAAALKVAHYIPCLESELQTTDTVRELKRKAEGRFVWQDKAADAIKSFRKSHPEEAGAFILNMAGTGCGKTTANAKIMSALCKEQYKLRFTLALGLRSLTLQTGDEYRRRLKLDTDDLAVVIGSGAVQYMYEQDKKEEEKQESFNSDKVLGSESAEQLFDADTYYEGALPQEGFATLFKNKKSAQMLYAPVVCCTIDHIMGATECSRGGQYMVPFLRLMSSDLVIDEVDDFTGDDLKAVGRLIYLCGALGRKLVLSSATLPPEIAIGFFFAYKEGYKQYCALRKKQAKLMLGWADNQACKIEQFDCESPLQRKFSEMHYEFAKAQASRIRQEIPKRKGQIFPCPLSADCDSSKSDYYFEQLLKAAMKLHQNHHLTDSDSGREISFGVIRLANIDPCVAAAKYLCSCKLPSDTEIRLMTYHSRQVMLLRHRQEHYLDRLLKRSQESLETPAILKDSLIRKHLKECPAKKLLFIVVCTPVEEVGRDHDYDWAVIEPSSWRSIVQLSGRVNRHRLLDITTPDVMVMQYNYRCFINGDKKDSNGQQKLYYHRPGYEQKVPAMPSHDLNKLLPSWDGSINAADRIVRDEGSGNQLALYEHDVIKKELFNQQQADSILSYPVSCWDLSAIAQSLSRFRKSTPSVELTLRKNNPEDESCTFCIKDSDTSWASVEKIYGIEEVSASDLESYGSRLWLPMDFVAEAEEYSALTLLSVSEVMERFGKIDLPDYGSSGHFYYSNIFGMYRMENQRNDR